MQHLEVSGAVRHIYIYVIKLLKVNLSITTGYHRDKANSKCKIYYEKFKA